MAAVVLVAIVMLVWRSYERAGRFLRFSSRLCDRNPIRITAPGWSDHGEPWGRGVRVPYGSAALMRGGFTGSSMIGFLYWSEALGS